MTKKRIVIVAALCAVLAGVAVVLVGRPGHESAPASQPPTNAAAKVTSLPPPGATSLRPPPELGVLVDDDKQGTLRLEGLVVDSLDHPVAGAQVTVSTNPPRTITSEADGSFAFDKLLGKAYTLVARAPDGVAGPVTARLTATSQPVTLRLRPAAAVEVTVITASDRKPVANATVELRDLETVAGTTADTGQVTFSAVAPGGYQAAAWAPGYAKAFTWVRVPRADAAGTIVQRVTLELRQGAPVAGVVRRKDGTPISGALVSFQGASEFMQRGDARRDAVVSDAAGRFRFEAMPAGSFRFVARAEGFAPGTSALVTLGGVSERSGIEIVMDTGGSIAGQVVDTGGAAVPFAAVRVVARVEGFSFDEARQTASDEQGRFEMTGLPRKKLDAVAVGESATSETVEIDLATQAERRDVTITLENAGTISGIVVDSKGQPVAEASVSASPSFRSFGRSRSARTERREQRFDFRLRGGADDLTDQAGRFTLRGLADGEYTLRAAGPGKGRSSLREGTEAKTGDSEVKIVLPADGGVKGRVLLAEGAAPGLFSVSLTTGRRGFGFSPPTPFSSSDGVFTLDDVPPGELELSVNGPDFEPKKVSVKVEADQVTDAGTITVIKGRKLAGRVVDASGKPVANARVVAGARLFGSGVGLGSGQGGGPPMGGGSATRTATTDELGEFALFGVGATDLAIAAEHETLGRSTTILVAATTQDSVVELQILPFGAIEGVISKDGAPAESVAVNVTAQNVPNTNFIVQSGPDGAYRFDKLAPDTYLVQAMGGQMMRGVGFVTKVVKVEPQAVAKVDIDMKSGSTVHVKVALPGGDGGFSFISYTMGAVTAKTYAKLGAEVAKLGASYQGFAPVFPGQDASLPDVPPGLLSVCAAALPAEVRGPAAFEYLGRAGDAVPVYCSSIDVSAGSEPTVTIKIDALPPFVPPPGGSGPPPPGSPGPGGPPPPGGSGPGDPPPPG
jgi:protocatechuate 3,4-dioxygenase beta subunit